MISSLGHKLSKMSPEYLVRLEDKAAAESIGVRWREQLGHYKE